MVRHFNVLVNLYDQCYNLEPSPLLLFPVWQLANLGDNPQDLRAVFATRRQLEMAHPPCGCQRQ